MTRLLKNRNTTMLKKVELEGKAAELVKLFIEVRDELEKLKEDYEERRKSLIRNREKLETKMFAFLDRTGQESGRTKYGTFYSWVDPRATVVDGARFIDFVLRDPEENIYLMEERANRTVCRDWILEHGKNVPGVELYNKRKIGVRRAS